MTSSDHSSDAESLCAEVVLRCTPTWTIIEGKDCFGVPGLSINDQFVPTLTNSEDSNAVEQIRKGMKAEVTKGALNYANMYMPQSDRWEDCVRKAATDAESKHNTASYYFKIEVADLEMSEQSAIAQVQSLASSKSNSKTIQFLVSRWTYPEIQIKSNVAHGAFATTDGSTIFDKDLLRTARQLCRINPAQRVDKSSHDPWLSAFDSTVNSGIKQMFWRRRAEVAAKVAIEADGLTDVYKWEILDVDDTLLRSDREVFPPDTTDYGLIQHRNC